MTQELVQRELTGELRVTPLGRLGAELGLPVRTLLLMQRWAEAARQVDFTALEVLLALALSPSGVEAAVPLLLSEQESSDYWSRTLIRAAAEGAAERPLFRWLRAQAGVVRFEQTRALKKALLLCDWAAGRDGAALETEYHVWRGSLERAATEFGRLVESLRAICALRGWTATRLHSLDTLASQLQKAPATQPGQRVDPSTPDSGAVVARAVFSIRAALLAGRSAAASAPPRPVSANAASGQAPRSGPSQSGPGGSAVVSIADHAVEPR